MKGITIKATAEGIVRASETSAARLSWVRDPVHPRPEAARQIGQQDHADGNAHHAKRQLVQAVGVVEPGHGPFVKAGHLTTDQQVDLHHTARQCGRGCDDGQAFQFRRHAGSAVEAQGEARAFGGPPDQRQLRNARNRHDRASGADMQAELSMPRPSPDPSRPSGPNEHGNDKDDVQHDRRSRSGHKAPRGIQYPRYQCRERDEQDIGKGNPPVFNGQIKAFVP